jgi:hypothetical protein
LGLVVLLEYSGCFACTFWIYNFEYSGCFTWFWILNWFAIYICGLYDIGRIFRYQMAS